MLAAVLAVGSSVRTLNTLLRRLDFVTGTPPRYEGARECSVQEVDRDRIVEHPAHPGRCHRPAIRAAVLVEPSRYFGVALAEPAGRNTDPGKRVPVRKTPLMAALQATAIQSVYGIMTASQVVRRWSDAVPAGIVPPRLAWRSLLWTVPLTLLWILLIYWQPTISASGVPTAAPRLMAYGLIGLGLWLGLESTDLTYASRTTKAFLRI
jgi:hypothetical protein